MKKLMVKKGSTCMACLECVRACSESFYKEFDPDKSCIQIVEKKSVRPLACPQCGKCAEACEAGAIKQNAKGVYMVNKKLCTGCGKCLDVCPQRCIALSLTPAVILQAHCLRCGNCLSACPVGGVERA